VLVVDDQAAQVGRNFTVKQAEVLAGAVSLVQYAGVEQLNLDAGKYNDRVDVTSSVTGGYVNLDGGGGVDTFTGSNAVNYFWITGLNTGHHSGTGSTVTFQSFENLLGQGGTDYFLFGPGGTLSGWINGLGGTDRLDYSACSADLLVNLFNGTATGVA